MAPSWKTVAREKQAQRAEQIASARKLLEEANQGSAVDTNASNSYLTASASEIIRNIESGKWTSLAVVTAYIRQAIKAHEQTNCLTEILFEQALEEAATLDAEFAKTKTLRGPLHGVPMTFKDCFEIAGTDATVGFTRWASRPSTTSAALVTHARALGAVILAKTNVPQTMFSFECSNPLFGRTLNPWSKDHTAGGSSGGEAAVLALNGSALGLGTDIGGSLRIPAGYCGVYSLKPSAGRMTRSGTVATIPGFESLNAVAGPLARSCEDVELACSALFGLPGLAHELVPNLPFIRPPPLSAKLRFGYYTSDGFCKASPACARAMNEAVEALRREGHECVEFDPHLAVDAMVLFAGIMSADGYKTMQNHLGPDPKESSLFLPTLGPRLPGFLRSFAAWVIRTAVGDIAFARCLIASRAKSAEELYVLQAQRDLLRKRWYEEIWDKYQFDGIIAPVQASPALPHGATTTLTPLAVMTVLYNVIDSPVGVVPVSRVSASADVLPPAVSWAAEPGHGSSLVEHELYGKKHAPYDPQAMQGLPLAVQVVGRSYEDEKVLKLMGVLDRALGERGFGPRAVKA